MEKLAGVITKSASTTEQMMNQIGSHLDRFKEASERWASFESKLVGFYTSIEQAQGKVVENSASLKEQLSQQTANINKLADAVQKSSVDALVEVRKSLQEVSNRMTSLHAPFSDAAEKMIDSSNNVQLNARTSNEAMLKIAAELSTRATMLAEIVEARSKSGNDNHGGGTAPQSTDQLVSAIKTLTTTLTNNNNNHPRSNWGFWRRGK